MDCPNEDRFDVSGLVTAFVFFGVRGPLIGFFTQFFFFFKVPTRVLSLLRQADAALSAAYRFPFLEDCFSISFLRTESYRACFARFVLLNPPEDWLPPFLFS